MLACAIKQSVEVIAILVSAFTLRYVKVTRNPTLNREDAAQVALELRVACASQFDIRRENALPICPIGFGSADGIGSKGFAIGITGSITQHGGGECLAIINIEANPLAISALGSESL